MYEQSIKSLHLKLKNKDISSHELCEYSFQKIKQQATLNAFVSLNEEEALLEAKAIDQQMARDDANPLAGLPMAHKDNICTKKLNTSCASRMLKNYRSPFDAFVVEQFNKKQCIMLGKTNMDEFGMGSSSENSIYGAVKNPWSHQHSAGGSSGGSAAAVAAGLIPFATGSDTGGSIRQPAAFCGISGLKPTYGMVSRFGLVAYASSLDQIGLLARSAEDLAMLLPVINAFDAKDSTSVRCETIHYSDKLHQPVTAKIGVAYSLIEKLENKAYRQALETAISQYQSAGTEIIPINIDSLSLWVPCYYVIACAEASSNLSRYDGVRFGHRAQGADKLQDMIKQSREQGFGEEVKRRILTGAHVLSSGYYDAYYLQALKIRRLIMQELKQVLTKVDAILLPTTPSPAIKLSENPPPVQRYLEDQFTVAANLAGLPAMSIPAGFSEGLPLGMQLIAGHFKEEKLLAIAHQFQQMTDWHKHQINEGNAL